MEFRIIDHCRWFSSAGVLHHLAIPHVVLSNLLTGKIHKMRSYSTQRGVVVISIISSTNQRGDIPRPVSHVQAPGHAIKGQSFENTSHQAFTQLNVTLCFNLCLPIKDLIRHITWSSHPFAPIDLHHDVWLCTWAGVASASPCNILVAGSDSDV